MTKRIKVILKTDQGIILPGALCLYRFNRNPCILLNHDCGKYPVGIFTEIKLNKYRFSGRPVFHRLTADSRYAEKCYKAGYFKLYPGGEVERDKDGNVTRFLLYEISLAP